VSKGGKVRGTRQERLLLDLFVEEAPGGDALVHVPSLPGLSVMVAHGSSRDRRIRSGLGAYTRWLGGHGLASVSPAAQAVVSAAAAAALGDVAWRVTESVAGAPVWISGNAAALFSVDRRRLSDGEAGAHLDVVGAALEDVVAATARLSEAERARGRKTGGRSVEETLTHIGNCIWWYASRIDDELPEPPDLPGEPPLARCVRLLTEVRAYLLAVPQGKRTRIHVPTRFPTNDPREPWTYAKVCRREAEHAWDHLAGIQRAAAVMMRRAVAGLLPSNAPRR